MCKKKVKNHHYNSKDGPVSFFKSLSVIRCITMALLEKTLENCIDYYSDCAYFRVSDCILWNEHKFD